MIPLGLVGPHLASSLLDAPSICWRGRSPDVEHLAPARSLSRLKHFFMQDPVVSQLVLRYMDDDDSDPKLGKVLLKFKAPVESKKHIKLFLLGSHKKVPIFQGVPPSIVNGKDFRDQ